MKEICVKLHLTKGGVRKKCCSLWLKTKGPVWERVTEREREKDSVCVCWYMWKVESKSSLVIVSKREREREREIVLCKFEEWIQCGMNKLNM